MSGALEVGYAVVIGITQADSVLVVMSVDLVTCHSAVQPSNEN